MFSAKLDHPTRREFLASAAAVSAASVFPAALSAQNSAPSLCFTSAVDMAALIRAKKLSAREALEEHLKQIDRVNQNQVVDWRSVRDDDHSLAELCHVALQVLHAIRVVPYLPFLQKRVELIARLESEQLPRLVWCQRTRTIARDRERLQGLARWISALCEIVRQFNRHLHTSSLAASLPR